MKSLLLPVICAGALLTTGPVLAVTGGQLLQTLFANASGTAATPSFAANPKASLTRSANTTQYTANTEWNNGSTGSVFSFTGACSGNGKSITIQDIHIWSSANPTTKLQGILWLFSGTPATVGNDDAAFNVTSADYALLTGNVEGFPFSLFNAQSTGSNSGITLSGVNYQAECPSVSTTLVGRVQVVNAYTPASGETLNVTLEAIGNN